MISIFNIFAFLCLCFSLSLEAREEIILTIPKSGTYYLKKIIETITGNRVIHPITPDLYFNQYEKYKNENKTIVMGHCEPNVLNILPQSGKKILLIRDPRDVVLSAIDFIDQKGVVVWPGISNKFKIEQWKKLTKKQKALILLDKFFDSRRMSIVNLFESAVNVFLQGNCLLIKFENLSPENKNSFAPRENILAIARFLGKEIGSAEIKSVLDKSFKNEASMTLNKGNIYRYISECDDELRSLLNNKLEKYIRFFGYDL